MSKVVCFLCTREGYLIKDGEYWRVIHDVQDNSGKWYTKHCYLGSLEKKVEKILKISKIRPGVIDPKVAKAVTDSLSTKNNENQLAISEIINNIFNLAKELGEGWNEDNHHDKKSSHAWNDVKCPHCNEYVKVLWDKNGHYSYVRLDKSISV